MYLVIRGGIAYAVAEPLGQIVGHFPLLVVEAALVELTAFALGNKNRFRLGLVAGVLIGTVGVVAEYAWSHVWMPIAWPSSMLPAAIGYGVAVGAGAGLVGAWLATRYAEVAGEERATGIIAGSIVPEALRPDDRTVVAVCASGRRATGYARTLDRPVVVLDGGIAAWRAEGRPTVGRTDDADHADAATLAE